MESAGTPIWSRIERGGRGPAPSLTHDRIAEVAVEIADAEGLEALSMRKIAARLGAGTMSLYRYVQSKDDLLELMVDRTFEAAHSVRVTGDWRADIAEIARCQRRVQRAHPWLAGSSARPTFGPNMLAMVEKALGAVADLGLDIDGMLDLWLTVSTFVDGYVQAELAEQHAVRRSELTQQQWRDRVRPYVMGLVESGKYPQFTRLVKDAEDFPDPDVTFERRLGYVLDGLESLIPPTRPVP
jgi:AcrR family transcriptional regulator